MAFKDLLKKATGYFDPLQMNADSPNFWNSKAADLLGKAQQFIDSPKSFKVVPTATIKPSDSFVTKGAKTLYNLPADIGNSIVGKGVLNVVSDIGNSVGRPLSGREMIPYKELKSAPGRLGYQLAGKLNPDRIKDLQIPMTAQETVGNVAGAAEAPINAYSGGQVFGIGKKAVGEATATTFKTLLKQLPRVSWEGAKMAGTAGFLSGLDQGREATNMGEQLKTGLETGKQGAIAGAILAPAATVAGFGVNKLLPEKFKAKVTPEKPVEMQTLNSDIPNTKLSVEPVDRIEVSKNELFGRGIKSDSLRTRLAKEGYDLSYFDQTSPGIYKNGTEYLSIPKKVQNNIDPSRHINIYDEVTNEQKIVNLEQLKRDAQDSLDNESWGSNPEDIKIQEGLKNKIYEYNKEIQSLSPSVGSSGGIDSAQNEVKRIQNELSSVRQRANLATSENAVQKVELDRSRLESELAKAQDNLKTVSDNKTSNGMTVGEENSPALGYKLKTPDGELVTPIKELGVGSSGSREYLVIDSSGKQKIVYGKNPNYAVDPAGSEVIRDHGQDNKTIGDILKNKKSEMKNTPLDSVASDTTLSPENIHSQILDRAASVKEMIRKISKGEQAIKQGGWGNNQFSPEELAGIQTAVDNYKAEIGQGVKVKSPLGELPSNSATLDQKIGTLTQENDAALMEAEQAKALRDMFNDTQLKAINKLKFLGKKTLDNGGDIESLRKKYPKIVEQALEAVREAEANITDDQEAFAYAMDLPTKAATLAEKPAELNSLLKGKEAIDQLKQTGVDVRTGENGQIVAANAEASPKTMEKILKRQEAAAAKQQEIDYKEWQKAAFGEAQTRTTKQAIDELAKTVQTNTNEKSLGLDFADTWKDKSRLSYARETMTRNFEDIMGKDAPEMKKKFLEPIAKSEADRIRFLNKERADINALGIAPRSNESKLVQEYGEGKITLKDLGAMTKDPNKIIHAADVLRGKYDQYIQELNTALTRNGYAPVPKRSDYFHHFQELTSAFDMVGVPLKANDLPTDINGLTADFKPGKQFFAATLKRKGDAATMDAIQGIDRYLEGASNQIFHTDNIKRLRGLETAIREKYAGTDHLTNFVADLGEYTNNLAGKKAMVDRAAESLLGRRIFSGVTAMKKQVGANMVGGNVASALTNYIPLTQTLATTDKQAVAQAMLATIKNTFKDDGFVESSDFLTRRLGSDRLSTTKWEDISKKAGWLFSTVDNFVSQVVARSKYLEGLKKGMNEEEAMKLANDWSARLMADRSKGSVPTLFNSQTLGLLTQFQLEVNNQMSFMAKDIPRNFNKAGAASALGQLFLYGYLFNNIYENITGRRPAFDPVGVAKQTYEDYANPTMKKGQATKNLIGNVSNNLPFVSTLTGGRIPLSAGLPNPVAVWQGDSTWGKEAKKLAYMLPPFGGSQAMKTIDGIKAYQQGASISPAGSVRFPIPKTVTNMLKTGVFGQWSTPEAQKYLREGTTPLGDNQSTTFKDLQKTDGEAASTYYDGIVAVREAKAQAKAAQDELTQPKKSWFKNMFAKVAEATPDNTASDPLTQMVLSEKARQEKRTLINDVLYGKDYKGLTQEQKQKIFTQQGINESDISEAKLSSMRSLSPANRAQLIMSDPNPDLNSFYKNDVLTPEVAKELERKGYIKDADTLIENLKKTDPYYIRKAQLKSMETMLKTKAATQKALIKANAQSVPKMLQALRSTKRRTLKKTMTVQKITQPKAVKPTAYKIRPL